MPLTLEQAITRLKENEDRVDTFVNLDGTYTTNEAVPREVETFPSLVQRLETDAFAGMAQHVADPDPHVGYQLESEKAAPGGYASLDSNGTVPDAQIPAGIARDSEVTAAVAAHVALGDPHTQYATDADLAAHVAAGNPHPVYATDSDVSALDAAVVKLTGDQTVAGNKTFSSPVRAPAFRPPILALGNVSGAQNVDVSAAGVITATVTGAWTPTFTNQPSAGQAQGVILRITNGEAFVITWPTINWAGLGSAPVLAVSGTDDISLLFLGGASIDGAYVGQVA